MEIDDLKAAIEELNGEPAPYLTGFFVFKGIPNPILRRIDFAKEVSDDLANKFSSYLRNYLAKEAKSTSLTVSKKTNVAALASYKPLPIASIGGGS